MPQAPQPPKTREALFALVAELIGWGTTVQDVESLALDVEASGVSFIPTLLIPPTVINPYAQTKNV